MARLRNLAITILRLSGATSIAAALRYHARREPQGSRCERGVLAWSLLACDRGQETVDVSLLLVPSLGCLESETSIHRGGQDPGSAAPGQAGRPPVACAAKGQAPLRPGRQATQGASIRGIMSHGRGGGIEPRRARGARFGRA